ncbi:hypothetical protein [Kribbella sp. NPDC055071]
MGSNTGTATDAATTTGSARLSRRTFLGATSALALLTMVEGCRPDAKGDAAAQQPIEEALKLLRDAVRESPDHLARRADDVVATKDASRIAAFVREHIAVVPPWSNSEDPAVARRWGTAATLRGGQGTLRERADLLQSLLTKAGFQASVKIADRPAALDLPTLYRDRLVPFAPDQKRIDKAAGVLAPTGARVPTSPPPFPPEAPDQVPAITAALPASVRQLTPRPDLLPDRIPVVTFTDKEQKYAFALGDLDPTGTPPPALADADPAAPLPKISVTVSALANPGLGSQTPRGQLIDLVQGEWTTDVVVGRQLVLSFIPAAGPQAALQTKSAADLPVRMPVLRVQTDEPDKAPPDLAGPIVSVQGEVYRPGKTADQLDGPYGPIKTVSADERTKAIASAATVKVEANASAFPEVTLDVSVRDKDGRSVDGLDASAFVVTDSAGKPSSVSIRSNAQDTTRPRVLIAYDTSGSVAEVWPSPQAKTTFEQSLTTTLQSAATKTPFDVQVVGLGQTPEKDAWQAPNAELLAALRDVNSDSSVWATVGGWALDQGLTAIVLISDNVSALEDPQDIPLLQRRLAASGVPVICLPIGTPDEKATSTILSLSHGTRLDPTAKDVATKLAAVIAPLAAKRAAVNYRLSYVAPAKGAAARTVTVTLTGRATPKGQASYQVPAKPGTAPSFIGLYVTFEVNGQTVRRRLAGLPLKDNGTPIGALDDATAAADTRAAMYGVTTIAFEPGITTQAAMLDDVLSSYLSIEPLRPIWKTASAEDIVKKTGNTVRRVPGLFSSVFSPVPVVAGAVPTFRVAILSERQVPDGPMSRHLDLPPDLNQVVALGPDPAKAFQAAVQASVGASVAEAATFDDSAFNRVSGQKLTPILTGDADKTAAFLATVPAAGKSAWSTVLGAYQDKLVLVPAAGTGGALWVVDPTSGATTAVLLDGTGGALDSCPKLNKWDVLNLIVGVGGLACTLGAVVNPLFCVGMTVFSIAFTAASVIESGAGETTPFGLFGSVFGASLPASMKVPMPGIGGRIGVAGLLITLTLITLECTN